MAGIFLCPIVVDPDTADPFNLVKVTVLWAFVFTAAGIWLIDKVRSGEGVRPSMTGWLALLVLLVNAAATLFSQNPALSAIGLYKRYGGLASTLLYVVALWLVIDLYRDRRERLHELVLATVWAGVIVGGYAILQQVGLDPIEWIGNAGVSLINPISTLGNSQLAGDYLGIVVPAFVYLLLRTPGAEGPAARRSPWRRLTTRRNLVGVGLALVLVGLWFTSSRSGIAAAVVGTGAVVAFLRGWFPRWVKVGTAGLLVLGSLLAVVVLWHPGAEEPPAPFQDREVLRAETVGYRLYWWQSGARMVLDNPVLGTGPDTFGENLPEYRTPQGGAELGMRVADKPHNIYLEHAVGAGVLGLGSYLLLVGAGLWWAWKRISRLDPPERLLLATFVGILTGYLAQGLFSIDVPPLAVMGWVALAGIAVIADPRVRSDDDPEDPRRSTRPRSEARGLMQRRALRVVASLVAIALVAGVLVLGTRPLRADQQVKEGNRVAARDGSRTEVIDHFARAFALHPYEPVHRAEFARYFEDLAKEAEGPDAKVAHFERAMRFYEEARELHPGNIFYMVSIAELHKKIANAGRPEHWEEADRRWQRILERTPYNWQAQARYGLMLIAWGEATDSHEVRCRAVERFQRVAELRPEEPRVWTELANAHLAVRQLDEARAALARAQEIDPEDPRARRLVSSLEGLSPADAPPCPG